jgi:hypothetical protein
MRNHPFVRDGGVTGERKKRTRAALIGASALTVAVFIPAALQISAAAAGPPQGVAADPPLKVVSVKVIDAGTIDTTFSNPMDPVKLKEEQFQAPHYYWTIPHTHIAVAFKLLNGNRTVRTPLDRALHPIKPLCAEELTNLDDPRCSTDTLEWQVEGATDIYGQKVSNKDWKVWVGGSKKHPDACRPGCP